MQVLSNMMDVRESISFGKLDHKRVLSCSQVYTTLDILIRFLFSLHVIIRLLPMVMNDYYKLLLIPPLLFTDHYWLFLILLVINVYHWLLLIMVINVDFTPHYDLSITWFSLLPNISNDLSSPQEQEEMQNPLVLHLLCFPTGLWLKFSEPDLKMKFSGLGLQLNIFGPGRLQQRLSRLWDKLLLLGIGLKTLMKV